MCVREAKTKIQKRCSPRPNRYDQTTFSMPRDYYYKNYNKNKPSGSTLH